jgi:hypothetical protein
MLSALALIFLFKLLPATIVAAINRLDPVFWLESIAIIAFGISWFTKGDGLLKDQ